MVLATWALLLALAPVPGVAGDWPESSERPVAPLGHPTLESRIEELEYQLENGYRFVVFGDQRALADGEWQALMHHVSRLDRDGTMQPPVLFLLDTGDIVQDGSHSDQFAMLRDILAPVRHLPYLVAVGNHEVDNNRSESARANLAAFLAYNDPVLDEHRFYYRKNAGPIRFLFLDTNDLVYGDPTRKDDPKAPRAGSRASRQLAWLSSQLAEEPVSASTTIVALHHPFVQSSKMHRQQALHLWQLEHEGRRLVDMLADAGVEVVIAGHTHTYERFRLEREEDGHQITLINLSGRPRNSFLFFGAGRRRPKDLRGREAAWLEKKGWDLGGWRITQEEAMLENERDQFAVFTALEDGSLTFQVHFLEEKGPGPVRASDPVRLK